MLGVNSLALSLFILNLNHEFLPLIVRYYSRLHGRSGNILAKPGRQTHLASVPPAEHTSALDALHSG